MGTTLSVNYNVPKVLSYFCVEFEECGRLKLVLAPKEVEAYTKTLLSSFWIIEDTIKSECYVQFKLKLDDWCRSSVLFSHFMCLLLKRYYQFGWHIKIVNGINKCKSDSRILFFEKGTGISTDTLSLIFNGYNRISVFGHENTFAVVKKAITDNWSFGLKKETFRNNVMEFILAGNPWNAAYAESNELFFSPILINEILSGLYGLGWVFCCTIKLKSKKTGNFINGLYFKHSEIEENTNKFFSISIRDNETLRVLRSTSEIFSIIHDRIPSNWVLNTQKSVSEKFSERKHNAFVIKLRNADRLDENKKLIESKKLINNLVNILRINGWHLQCVWDPSKHISGKNVLFFKWQSNFAFMVKNVSLTFNQSDKMSVIAGNQTIIGKIRDGIIQGWPWGIQEESNKDSYWQYKLCGYPFSPNSKTMVHTLIMLLYILDKMHGENFNIIGNANLNGVNNKLSKSGVSIWFFEKV